jgi:hypothetical protein
VTSTGVVADTLAQVHGMRARAPGSPGVIRVGTWRSQAGNTFAVCHGPSAGIVINLTRDYDRAVMTIDHPEAAAAGLS